MRFFLCELRLRESRLHGFFQPFFFATRLLLPDYVRIDERARVLCRRWSDVRALCRRAVVVAVRGENVALDGRDIGFDDAGPELRAEESYCRLESPTVARAGLTSRHVVTVLLSTREGAG